jgi:hypothetical protein
LRLETRADAMAKGNEAETGAYAQALLKLYTDNLLPAVSARKRATHPHLYDRLLAAGVTPDFPRPAPALSMSWNGWVFSLLAGFLFGIFAIQLIRASP